MMSNMIWVPLSELAQEVNSRTLLDDDILDASILNINNLGNQIATIEADVGLLSYYLLGFVDAYKDGDLEIATVAARVDSRGEIWVTRDPYICFLAIRETRLAYRNRKVTPLEKALSFKGVPAFETEDSVELWFNSQRHSISVNNPDLQSLRLCDPTTEVWRLDPLLEKLESK